MLDWLLAYGTLGVGALFSLGVLYKESEEYISKRRGKPLLLVMYSSILLMLMGGIFQTHQTRSSSNADRTQAAKDREQAAKDRKALDDDRSQAKQERAVNDTKLNDAKERLQTLQDRVSRLQTKAETQALSKQLLDVKSELAEAESKLQQPKAHLVATFGTPHYNELPVKEVVGEKVAGTGAVKFNFGVLNASDVAALHGEIVLKICDACSFATEPEGFSRAALSPDNERIRDFGQIQEHTVAQDMTATVIPPITTPEFQVGIIAKCENCETAKLQILKVKIPPVLPPDFKTPKKVKSATNQNTSRP
jgi:hypothetical protein